MCTELIHKFLPGLAPEVDDYVCGMSLNASTDAIKINFAVLYTKCYCE